MEATDADLVVDCTGLQCPMPIVEMAKGIRKLAVGNVLRIDTDAEALQSDVPSWCKTTGHELVKAETTADTTSYYIRKSSE